MRACHLHLPDESAESCPDGLIIAGPVPAPASTSLQLFCLLWLFYGVGIGADMFMEAIETITSQVRTTSTSQPLSPQS